MDVRPYPFAQLPRLSRRDAVRESAIARLVAARAPRRLAQIAGEPVAVRLVGTRDTAFDPHAAVAELRIGGTRLFALGASRGVRQLAQRLLGGPDELDAPRALTAAEHAVWAMVCAAALDDAGVDGQVWPDAAPPVESAGVELAINGMLARVCGGDPLALRVPPGGFGAWTALRLEVVVALGRCALTRAALDALAVRDVIALERAAGGVDRTAPPFGGAVGRGQAPAIELVVGDAVVALACAPGAMEARIASEYSARDMALPDSAHLELTVALGTTALSVRELAELAVGAVVPLGRALAGPFELRAGGRVIGHGELVEIDGELGVRVVSLG